MYPVKVSSLLLKSSLTKRNGKGCLIIEDKQTIAKSPFFNSPDHIVLITFL